MRYFIFVLILSCANRPAENHAIKRIISLAPNLTETAFFIGAGDRLVGVTTYCNYPPGVREIEKVGDFANPSLERIVSLRPDIVLLALPEQRRLKTELEKLKIQTFASQPHNLLDIIDEIDSLARLLKQSSPKESLLDLLKPIKATENRPGIYIELSSSPIITIGKTAFLDDVIKKAGGINIFTDISIEFPVVSWEEILRRDPDIILIFHNQKYRDREGWNRLTAPKTGMVFADLDQDIFLRPGPRTFKALKILKSIIDRCAGRSS